MQFVMTKKEHISTELNHLNQENMLLSLQKATLSNLFTCYCIAITGNC